jgi:hypothetical protein
LGVYPNPVLSSSKVVISGVSNFTSSYLTIINGIGQVVERIPGTQSVMGVDFGKLPHGVYQLQYNDAAGNSLLTKVVK